MNHEDFSALTAEFNALSESVELTGPEAESLRERVLDLKAGKALQDELDKENDTLRDSILATLKDLKTKKVTVDGQSLVSVSLPPRTNIDWDQLERLAPKAMERSRFQTYAYRVTTGRIKA